MHRTWLSVALFALLWAIACRPPAASDQSHTYGALGSIYPPPSWAVANWYVDPANSTAAASDNNSCTSSGAPCLTWKEIIRRYGTYEPVLRQNTTVTFLSSHTDDSDPVIWRPFSSHQVVVQIQGSLGASQQIATGTISSLTAKNRATPQLLQATFPAGVVSHLLVVNSTHASRAWTYAQVSGNTYSISQPLTAFVPGTTFNPSEVDTWANTDSVTLYQPVSVNLVQFKPQLLEGGGGGGSLAYASGYVYNIKIFQPTGGEFTRLGSTVGMIESSSARGVTWDVASQTSALGVLPNVNDDFIGAIGIGTLAAKPSIDATTGIYGGLIEFNGYAVGVYFDFDVIMHFGISAAWSNIGTAEVDSGGTLTVYGGPVDLQRNKSGSNILWGAGTLNVTGGANFVYPSGANQAAASLKISTLQINGGTTACSVGTGASAAWNCGITVTAAHLDAAVGSAGFGGVAYNPGGGSITNLGP